MIFFGIGLMLVVWVSIQRGWRQGLLAAVVAWLLCWPGSREQAAALLGSALFTGGLADANRRRIRALRHTVAHQAIEIVQNQENIEVLQRANQELLAQVSDQQSGLATLYEVYRRLSSSNLEELQAAIVDVVADTLAAEQCSLYTLEGQVLRLEMAKGWPSIPEEARKIELNDDLMSLAVQRKQLCSLQNFPLERLNPEQPSGTGLHPLMVCPILHPKQGHCLGAISVESLPFSRFTRSSAQLLETIAELAGQSLSSLHSSSELAAPGEWLSKDFFRRRLRGELASQHRGTRAGFCLVILRILGWEQQPPSLLRLSERALQLFQDSHFRASDIRGRCSQDTVGVMLPATEPAMAQSLSQSFQKDVGQYLGSWLPEMGPLRFEVGMSASGGIHDPEELVAQARAAARPDQLQPAAALDWSSVEGLEEQLKARPEDVGLRNLMIRTLLESARPDSLRQASEQFSLLKLLRGRS